MLLCWLSLAKPGQIHGIAFGPREQPLWLIYDVQEAVFRNASYFFTKWDLIENRRIFSLKTCICDLVVLKESE